MAKVKNKQILVSTDFDINSKKLINVAAGVTSTDAVNVGQLNNAIGNAVAGAEWVDSVKTVDVLTPPVTPTLNDRYLIFGAGTGAWAGKDNQIAQWNGASWDYTVPSTGTACLVDNDPSIMMIFGTTQWSAKSFDSTRTTKLNKTMSASVTTSDGNLGCANSIAETPANDSYVEVAVNGVIYKVGDALKTSDCYFSSNAGITAKSIANIAVGDLMYWNGSVAGFQLDATDKVDFNYIVTA